MGYPRYAFDLRFDVPPACDLAVEAVEATSEPAEAPDPPIHGEMALRRAEAEAEARGFSDGFEAGRAEGLASAATAAEAEAAEVLAAVKDALHRIAGHMEAVTAAVEADAAAVTAALARRLAPGLVALEAGPVMERLAVEALRAARTSPVLEIRVRPEAVAELECRLAGVACTEAFAGRLSVAGDPALGRGAIHADWAGGSLAHDPAAVETAVAVLADRTLDGLRAAIPTETQSR